MILFGTHGTIKGNIENISKSNFYLNKGRGGTGTYFWRKNDYSILLAKGWHDFYVNKNKYDKEIDNDFAYIEVKIDVDEQNFLDLELPELKDKIANITIANKLDRKTNDDDIAALFDCFIKRLEEELNIRFYVWQLRVNAPYNLNDYPVNILGNPICYVVNNNELITIESCYVVEGNNERQIL